MSSKKRLTHDELVDIGRRWCARPYRPYYRIGKPAVGRRGGCSLVVTEISTSIRETPDVLGWWGQHSVLLEAKATRSDFRADLKKSFRTRGQGLGNLRYYIVPQGMVEPEEVPEGWGLIEVTSRRGAKVTKDSDWHNANKGQEIIVMHSLVRRLKIDPGKHVMIRVYVNEKSGEPRATATVNYIKRNPVLE